MSRFFEALEQAERDRALRDQARPLVIPTPKGDVTEPLGISGAARDNRSPRKHPPLSEPGALGDGSLDGIDGHLVSLLAPASFAAERYRALRHALEQLHSSRPLGVVAVSSAAVRDGKTTTAINLAGALAQAPGNRVLLLEADLRRPSVSRRLGFGQEEPGLVDLLTQPRLSLDSLVRFFPLFNLAVLPAGRPSRTPYELLKAPRLESLFADARSQYDYVLVDTPPLLPTPDAHLVGKWVDGFLLVVAAHQTPRRFVTECLTTVDPARMLGLVFNGDDQVTSRYYAPARGSGDDGRARRLRRRWSRDVDDRST